MKYSPMPIDLYGMFLCVFLFLYHINTGDIISKEFYCLKASSSQFRLATNQHTWYSEDCLSG